MVLSDVTIHVVNHRRVSASINDPSPKSCFAEMSVLHSNSVVPWVFEELAGSIDFLFEFQVINSVENNGNTGKHDVKELEDDRFEENLS